jgi:tetratricopeptide (TPR) repeat protein
LGEFPDAVSTAAAGVRIADDIGQPYSRINAYVGVGWVSLYKGEFPDAISQLEQALALNRTSNIETFHNWAVGSLALALARTGRASEALRLAREVFRLHPGLEHILAPAWVWLGEIHLHAGFPDEARQLVLRALEILRQDRDCGREAEAWCVLGAIALAARPPDLAASEAHYGQALQLATQLGMRPLVAHCHLGLGKLYRRTSDGAKADEQLTTAATMYREMDMGFWLQKAEAELAGVDR